MMHLPLEIVVGKKLELTEKIFRPIFEIIQLYVKCIQKSKSSSGSVQQTKYQSTVVGKAQPPGKPFGIT